MIEEGDYVRVKECDKNLQSFDFKKRWGFYGGGSPMAFLTLLGLQPIIN